MYSLPLPALVDDLCPQATPSRHAPRWMLAALALLAALGSAQPPAGQGNPPPGELPARVDTPPAPASEAPKQIVVEGDEVTLTTDQDRGLPFLEFVKIAQKITGKTFVINQA